MLPPRYKTLLIKQIRTFGGELIPQLLEVAFLLGLCEVEHREAVLLAEFPDNGVSAHELGLVDPIIHLHSQVEEEGHSDGFVAEVQQVSWVVFRFNAWTQTKGHRTKGSHCGTVTVEGGSKALN